MVRSLITSRSNSAKAPKIWKMSLPPEVVVSMCSCRLMKPISCSLSSVTVAMSCLSVRPSRSSRQTTSVSPALRWCMASCRPGRSALAPLIVSVKIFSQPACVSASVWRSSVWSWVETRAYPISILAMFALCLEQHQLPALFLLLVYVVSAEHGCVEHAAQVVDAVDLRFLGDMAILAVQRQGDPGFEIALPLLRHGHRAFSVSKLIYASKQ